ncbi:GTPase Era [Collibacillus ludicampi]|uniref:GTPase Era n=1 Tax=Collibacillus ludicampi TaxID=2771369 RepID=A0AAV4LAD3_9BACL|nr:GTPase Era [Collibacillus ludicampi]GIM44751.1 GTPase Era [Collibacillus ludicampi]
MAQKNHKSGFVAIIGRPNVGKSTLLNHMVGQKVAIMSDKPQTTRNRIRGVMTLEDMQVIFLDTPGIHKPRHKLGDYMVRTSINTLKEVDLIFFVVDATEEKGAGDQFIIENLQGIKTPVFLLINKVDAIHPDKILETIATYKDDFPFAEIVPVSALQGQNIERLVQLLHQYLPEGPQYYPPDQVTDHPERFIVAELIREKVLHLTREEVPHSVAVAVEQMESREDKDLLYIHAVIFTERESQKGILIGKQGGMLKEVGRLARADIQKLFGSKVYLELWVKVKKDWRNREHLLRNFGFDENL